MGTLQQMLLASLWAQGHWKCQCSSLYTVIPLSFSGGWDLGFAEGSIPVVLTNCKQVQLVSIPQKLSFP